MIFDPKPKEKRVDLYDFEEEIDRIVKELHDSLTRMIVIKGLRRTGKSSILRVSLNEAKLNYILVDMREFEDVSPKVFGYGLSKALNDIVKGRKRVLLEKIKAVSFIGMKIELKTDREMDPSFRYKSIFRKINHWAEKKNTYFILAIDEAQELAKIGFDRYLAFLYDNLDRIKIVLTGSQVGVMDNILDNPDKPLFGRARIDIETKYLSKKQSISFLQTGFRELKIKIDPAIIERAAETLDGVIGWLTLFGWLVAKKEKAEEALQKTIELGIKTAYKEFERFLDTRGTGRKRYLEVMKILSEEPKRWSEIKTLLEIRLKRIIPNNQITKYLKELRKYGFITKKENKYKIPDPILRKAITRKT